jgi:hypothetical protein
VQVRGVDTFGAEGEGWGSWWSGGELVGLGRGLGITYAGAARSSSRASGSGRCLSGR